MRRNESLRHALAIAAAYQGTILPGNLLLDGVVLRPLVATDVENVAVALGGNHAGSRALIFQQGIGRDRGAVVDQGNAIERNGLVAAQLGNRAHDPNGRIVRGGWHFMDCQTISLGVCTNGVCERPAYVNSNESHV